MHESEHLSHSEDTFEEIPYVTAELVEPGRFPLGVPAPPRPRRRKVWLPLILFAATCLSTFFVGSHVIGSSQPPHRLAPEVLEEFSAYSVGNLWIYAQWLDGLTYMAAVMGILLAHEMGHFLQALRYRVPASLPFFIPIPLPPIGTMGAVIGMQGSVADRKQMFDIGLTGPLAGLLVAVPITWIGIQTAEPFVQLATGEFQHYADPLLFKLLIGYLRPELAPGTELTMNPLLMAGWVGMLITGLNMVPISQLDGGHVSYALFGRRAHLIARGFLLFVIACMIIFGLYMWTLMVILVLLIGTDHPPTANDNARIGPLRWIIGFASLAIPILCLTPRPFAIVSF